jgi:hypothetical protein
VTGSTSGVVSIQGQAAAGTYNFNLPTSAGTAGQPLLSGGGGSSAMTFGTLGVPAGGTGITSGTQYGLPYFTTATLMASTAAGTATTVLHGNPAGAPTWGAVVLTTDVSGTLPATNGGTGIATYAIGDTLYASAANALSKLAGNTTAVKQYLSQTGTGSASAAPVWATIAGADITGAALTSANDTNVTLTLGGTPTTALLRATSITAGWTGLLSVARGGTGAGSFTANGVLLGNGTSAVAVTAVGTNGQVLMGNTSAAPTFQTQTAAIEFVIDGGGTPVTTGFKGYLTVPFACTVSQWTMLADQSGSATIDITSDAYANYGTNTSMVGAGTKPNISASTKGQSAPASWTTTSIAAGNVIGFNVTTASTVTRVTIILTVSRTSA